MCLPSGITGNDIANVVDILTCGEPGKKGNTMLDCLKIGDKPTIHQIHREYGYQWIHNQQTYLGATCLIF